ncbi:hypothetical protein B9Z55_022946 [Caenorhabditis nigoni]|uniref:Uncharacterized protein n=1 Tax=Caenorhabditis nigoni TaxID=1611254 RepID=A0A2G5SN52_9PELO|nr:hypothetical protein B9Z55_022946 [Caenorhabditis nigoni]
MRGRNMNNKAETFLKDFKDSRTKNRITTIVKYFSISNIPIFEFSHIFFSQAFSNVNIFRISKSQNPFTTSPVLVLTSNNHQHQRNQRQ